jgi:hypothetical protein
VAVVDPIICDEDTNVCEDKIKEVNELDNIYPSLLTTFGTSETVDTGEEDDEGLLGLPSISVTIAMSIFGVVALARRRR